MPPSSTTAFSSADGGWVIGALSERVYLSTASAGNCSAPSRFPFNAPSLTRTGGFLWSPASAASARAASECSSCARLPRLGDARCAERARRPPHRPAGLLLQRRGRQGFIEKAAVAAYTRMARGDGPARLRQEQYRPEVVIEAGSRRNNGATSACCRLIFRRRRATRLRFTALIFPTRPAALRYRLTASTAPLAT